jgi:hypothetical protein
LTPEQAIITALALLMARGIVTARPGLLATGNPYLGAIFETFHSALIPHGRILLQSLSDADRS